MATHLLPTRAARRRAAPHTSRLWLATALVLLTTLVAPLLGPQSTARADIPTALTDQATLETRQPEVQWSVATAVDWVTADPVQTVRTGDRVRTGVDASARLIYFEGTVIEIAPSTGLLVERLATTETGGIVSRLFQTAGVTVSRVVHLVDPAASFEVETPAAVVFVRGTTPRVEVDPDDTTHVQNVPDGMGSKVGVRGRDAAQTEVILLEGEETDVLPGLPPAPPRPTNPVTAPAVRTPLPALPVSTPTTGVSRNPCQQPGVVCSPFPTVDPCHIRPSLCAPSGPIPTGPFPPGPGTTPPFPTDPGPPAPPSDTGPSAPRPTATPRPPAPTPTPTLSTNPCQRPGVVCDPLPPIDPCRLRPRDCGSGGPDPATPTPTLTTNPCQRPGVVCDPLPPIDPCRLRARDCGSGGQEMATPTRTPPPILFGDPGSSRPRPTVVTPSLPSGDTGGGRTLPIHLTPGISPMPAGESSGGRTLPTLPQLPILTSDTGGGRSVPSGSQASTGDSGSHSTSAVHHVPVDDLGSIRRVPTVVTSQQPSSQQSSGPIVR